MPSIWQTLSVHRIGGKRPWKCEKTENNDTMILLELCVVVHKSAREIACAMADVGLLLRENGSDQSETTRWPALTQYWQPTLPGIE